MSSHDELQQKLEEYNQQVHEISEPSRDILIKQFADTYDQYRESMANVAYLNKELIELVSECMENGISQGILAKAAGVSRQRVSQLSQKTSK